MNFSKKLYAFDFGIYNPFRMSNSKVYVNPAKKENIVFFKEDKPWEVRYDNSYPTVFYDEIKKIYRMYYSTFSVDPETSKYTREEKIKRDYIPRVERVVSLCYAESKDGVNWEKPELGLVEFDGSKKNNIIGTYLHGTSVMLDYHEKDESKRYKMFTKIDYGNGIHFIAVAFSSDGIKFSDFIKLDNFNPRADTHNHIIWDSNINKYVLITRMWKDSLRLPCMSLSTDFLNWSQPVEIIQSRSFENQIYSMPIFRHGEYILGLASMFHEGDMMEENFDKVDVELTYSYRYNMWHYIEPGTPFIKRGEGNYVKGDFDAGCIYSSPPIEKDDKFYFYYIGGNGQHTNFREGHLSRCFINKDRLAYIAPKNQEKEAIVYTNAFIFLENNINVDLEIEKGGSVIVEGYENNHKAIEGLEISLEKTNNGYVLKFNQDRIRKLTRLKFIFKKAKIYSISGSLDVHRIESENTLLRQ